DSGDVARVAGHGVGQRTRSQRARTGNTAHTSPNGLQAFAADHRCQAVPADIWPPTPAGGGHRRGRSHPLDARDRNLTRSGFESAAGDQRRSSACDRKTGQPITVGKHSLGWYKPDQIAGDCKPEGGDVSEFARFAVTERKPLPEHAPDRAAALAEPLSPGPVADPTPDSMSLAKFRGDVPAS